MPKPLPYTDAHPQQMITNWVYDELRNILMVGLDDGQWEELESKLDTIISKINDAIVEMSDDATTDDINRNIAKLDEILNTANSIKNVLDVINNRVATQATLELCRQLLREIKSLQKTPFEILGETEANVDTNGIIVELESPNYGEIRRVFVKHTLGPDQYYSVWIYRRNPSDAQFDSDFDAVYYRDRFNKNRHDDWIKVQDVQFNLPNNDGKLYMKITPTSGTSNKFKYGIFGFQYAG